MSETTTQTQQETLLDYLQTIREAVLWKLDGAGEYDVRRPLTPTGSNLLGLVKHLAYVELGYFVTSFGRPMPVPDCSPTPAPIPTTTSTRGSTSRGRTSSGSTAWRGRSPLARSPTTTSRASAKCRGGTRRATG